MKTEIVIGQIQVNEIRNNASAVYGDNNLQGWRSHSKVNNSLGRVNGDANLIASRLNYLSDPDGIDVNVAAGSEGEKSNCSSTGEEPGFPGYVKPKKVAMGHYRQKVDSKPEGCAAWPLPSG